MADQMKNYTSLIYADILFAHLPIFLSMYSRVEIRFINFSSKLATIKNSFQTTIHFHCCI